MGEFLASRSARTLAELYLRDEAVGISLFQAEKVERAMGFEPTTSCLGSKHSTPELRPLVHRDCIIVEAKYPLF